MASPLDIASLSIKERLDLIGELWDSLAPGDASLTPAQNAELARRMEKFEKDTKTAKTLAEIEAEFDGRRTR